MASILSSKWGLAALAVLAGLLILFLIGKKSVQAEVVINASPQKVWTVLTDFSEVKKWNDVLIPMQGTLEEGTTISYEFYQEKGGKATAMNAKVKQVDEHELIHQQGGIPGVLTFNHRYIITPNGQETSVQILEKYRGVMVPFWNPNPVEKAYERLLKSLKQKVENTTP